MFSAVIGMGGAVIGGSLVILGKFLEDRRASKARSRTLAFAIAAEIEAYLDLMEMRDHVSYARDLIRMNRGGTRRLPKEWISGFEREYDPLPVMRSAIPEIGLLGTLGGDVAKFYTQVTAVRATLMSADDGKYDDACAEDLAFIFEKELELWLATVDLGRLLTRILRQR